MVKVIFRVESIFPKISLLTSCVAFWLFLIGYSTSYWFNGPLKHLSISATWFNWFSLKAHMGLWHGCDSTGTLCFTPGGDSWFEAVQAFETLGFIAALVSLVLVVLYIFVPATSGKKIVFILCMIACFAAAGCIILGIIIYGAKVERNLSWSFALCTIAGIIFGVSGILLIVDMMKR